MGGGNPICGLFLTGVRSTQLAMDGKWTVNDGHSTASSVSRNLEGIHVIILSISLLRARELSSSIGVDILNIIRV
jgi:hypothetical protein